MYSAGFASRVLVSGTFFAAVCSSFAAASGHAGQPVHGAQAALGAPAAIATPIACPPNPFLCGNGDIWDYAETGTETITNPSGPPAVYNFSDVYSILQTCPATFNGFSNLCGWESTYASQPGLLQDEYMGYVPQGSRIDLDDFGGTVTTSDGTTFSNETDKYSPPRPIDAFPQAKGNRFNILDQMYRSNIITYGPHGYRAIWNVTNPASGTYHETYSVDQPQQHSKLRETWTLRRDASGEYDQVVSGSSPSSSSTVFGAPTVVGSQWVIPVTVTTPSGTTSTNVPDWLPGGQAAPKRLQNLIYVDEGTVLIPAECGAYAGQQAENLHIQQFYILDPVAGAYQVGSGDIYIVDGIGNVCDTNAYTVTYYDNTGTGAVVGTVSQSYTDVLTNDEGAKTRGKSHHTRAAQGMSVSAAMMRNPMEHRRTSPATGQAMSLRRR